MGAATYETLLELEHVRVGAAGPVMLSRFTMLGDLSGVIRVQQTALALARRTGSKIGSLVVVGHDRTAFNGGTAEERAEFIRILRTVDPLLFATGIVVTSSGFSGAALRAFLSGISLAASPPYPMKVFDAFDKGLAWIVERTEPSVDRVAVTRQLTLGYKQICERFR